MRLVLQRAKSASVKVGGETVGEIAAGWVVLLGVCDDDDAKDVDIAVDKTANLRMFSDESGKFNLSVLDTKGEILVVSQFTLYGDCRKGRRPSFSAAGKPEHAAELYEDFVEKLKETTGLKVETGVFQAHMDVELINDGPVTMLVDTKRTF